MLRRLVNLPFKVIGRAARVVQDRSDARMKAEHGTGVEGDDFTDLENVPEFDTPDDFRPSNLALSVVDARAAIDSGRPQVFVDLRLPDAFARGALPKADNLPLATLGIRLAELPPAHVRVVVYCADGGEASQEAARFLRFRGIEDACYLKGGIRGWTASGPSKR
mgnify:CR=1 FL=1